MSNPTNQRNEDLKKAQAQLEVDRFRAKKLLKDVPVSALRMNFLIEQLVYDYQIIRQSWEQELEATKDYARQLADKGIALEKEKAGLEERVRELEEEKNRWISHALSLEVQLKACQGG